MTMLAETYPARQAQELGLVTEVVDDGKALERSLEMARKLAAQSPLAIRLAKGMMKAGQDMTLQQSQREAALAVMVANPSKDVAEGVRAFFNKKKPNFTGH